MPSLVDLLAAEMTRGIMQRKAGHDDLGSSALAFRLASISYPTSRHNGTYTFSSGYETIEEGLAFPTQRRLQRWTPEGNPAAKYLGSRPYETGPGSEASILLARNSVQTNLDFHGRCRWTSIRRRRLKQCLTKSSWSLTFRLGSWT